MPSRRFTIGLSASLLALSSLPALAGEAAERHAAWQGCLSRSFALQSAMTGRRLAADAALRQCRQAETAYLDALAASPLLDPEDVARARPMLLVRAREGLVARAANPDL
ncbi:hypothetical protein [Methylobacterium sp. sgz302541]|uniref:hypothetical protein n=1 Tax=unclassified Methylobacterium TaxID=2615210 RepID=UPI003D33E226